MCLKSMLTSHHGAFGSGDMMYGCLTNSGTVSKPAQYIVCCLFIYVHEEFIVEPMNIAFHSTRWEGYCLKITQSRPYVRHYVIANIYRPPFEAIDDLTLFNEQFFYIIKIK